MPKRFTVKQRWKIYKFLCERDGEWCRRCGRVPIHPLTNEIPGDSKKHDNVGKVKGLDIHHIDGNPRNNQSQNLELLCHRCNTTISNKQREKFSVTCARECGREYKEEKSATSVIRKGVDYSQGNPSMRVNARCEIPFRKWVIDYIRKFRQIERDVAINGGAEFVGCGQDAAERYTKKLTSITGPLEAFTDDFGTVILKLRKTNKQEG